MSEEFDGNALREWRKAKGLRREDVAAACHVSVVAVHNWENGRNKPHPALLPTLARLMSGEIALIPLTAVEEKLLDEAVSRGRFAGREDFLASALLQVIRGNLSVQEAETPSPLTVLKVADKDHSYGPEKNGGSGAA